MLQFELHNEIHKLKLLLESVDGINNSILFEDLIYKDNSTQVKFYIYVEDNHKRPHFHVYYKNEFSASICIKTGEKLAGNMPSKYIKAINKWRNTNSKYLIQQWEKVQSGNNAIKFCT